MKIRGCSGYVVVCSKGHFHDVLASTQYGSGKLRKPLHEKPKQWLQAWNIITFFLEKHFIQKRQKNRMWDSFFINVHSKMLESVLGDPWRNFQPILTELGILEKNEIFQKGKFSQSYRINKDLIHSPDLTLVDLSEDNLDRSYQSSITIDSEALLPRIDEIANERVTKRKKKKWSPFDKIMYIKAIKEFNFYDRVTVCSTGREFNKANGIPSEFREYIYIDGEPTTEIDIKSSLPCVLFKFTEGNEKRKYGKLITEGSLYESFATELGSPNNRELAKKAFTHYLGGYRQYVCAALDKALRKEFPKLHQWIEGIEQDHITKNPEGKGGQVSRLLQKIESKIIVVMMDDLNRNNIPTVSIHDGVRVKTYHADLVESAIRKAFKQLVGIEPVLTVDDYEPDDSRDDLDKLFDEATAYTYMMELDHVSFEEH